MPTLRGYVVALWLVAVVADSGSASAADFGVKLPVVKRIEILGNRSFDDATLKKRIRTKEARFYRVFRQPRYRRDILRRDVEALLSFYRMNGFFKAAITVEPIGTNDKSNPVTIRLMVSEGPQTLVRSVRFAGQSLVQDRDLRTRLELSEGAPYNSALLEVDRYNLYSKFFENGYLGSKILYDVHTDSTKVDIDWTITTGDQMMIRDVRVAGKQIVREKFVRREFTFKRGESFRAKKILESKQNLYDTGYFNSVEIEPDSIDITSRQVDLRVQVRERKMGYLETGFGVGNVYGNRIFGELGHRNIFGTGNVLYFKSSYAFQLFPNNQFSLSKIDFRSKFMRNEGELRFPHILSTWNTFSLGAFYEKDATVEPVIIKDLGLTARISRRFSRQTSLFFGYSLERIQRLEIEEEKSRSRRRGFDATYTRDTRDLYFNPRQGMYMSAEGRFTGGFLGGEDHFYSLAGSVQRYMRIPAGAVLAYRVRAGYADAFGSSRASGLPIESKFFAGGGNSVRGFRENSLGPVRDGFEPRGGRALLLTNAEIRFPLPLLARYNFGGALFFDGGNVWSSVKDISAADFRLVAKIEDTTRKDYMYGTGFGMRYYTPVGPIRFDIGFPIKKTGDMDYDYWIHISLGQIF